MNALDVVAILVVVLAAIAGFRSGALPQLGGLTGALLGAILGLTVLPAFAEPLAGLDPLPRALAVLGGILVLVGIGEALGSTLGRRLGDGLGSGIFGAVDDIFGAAVGVLQAVLVVWLVGSFLAISPFPRLASLAQTSVVVRALDEVGPAPEAVAGEVADLLDDSGLPDLFIGLEPLPAPPVARPTDPEAAAVARKAEGSTVKVTSSACGAILSGSGVVVSPGYVVTNAHVVAGARTTRVVLGGATFDAIPVLFDPELDVALLRAAKLKAPPMRFSATDPKRGIGGAALGYPGGGGLAAVPAAVARRLDATGRDIYDDQLVTRAVLELRADIEQGDSGGPLVLKDGTIGGLVFAEARTDPSVGYALTPTSVATRIAPAIGRVTEVDTGPCIK